MGKNLGPGGCVPWDDFDVWLRRLDIHVRALDGAANIDASATVLRPLWTVIDSIKGEMAAAAVAFGVTLGPGDGEGRP